MSLAERISEQQRIREQAAAANQRRREAERQQQKDELAQAQKEYDDLVKQQQELDRQLAELERQEQEEREQIALQQKRQEEYESGKRQIQQKYQTKIDQIISERESLVQKLTTPSAPQRLEQERLIRKEYEPKIRQQEVNMGIELQQYEFAFAYPGESLTVSQARAIERGESAVKLRQQQEEADRAQAELRARAGAVGARSAAVKERERLESIKLDFEQKRRAEDSKLGAELARYQNYSLETSIKKEPGIRRADPFSQMIDVDPKSIYGTTKEKSDYAVYTFEETERQQSELEKLIRGAKTPAEAYAIKKEFQTENPYVGTAQVYKYKGKTLDVQGVTIEKELNTAIPEFDKILKTEPKATQEKRDILLQLQEDLSMGDVIGGEAAHYISEPKSGIPEIIFLDERGQDIESPTVDQMWNYTKDRLALSQKNYTMSDLDRELAEYERANLDEIDSFMKTEKAKLAGTITPIVDLKKDSYESGIMGHTEELRNLMQGKETEKPSLEALAFSDLSNFVKSGLGLEERRESEAYKTIKEKVKTPEGQAWLAGTLTGSAIVAAATVVIPGAASLKIAKVLGRQTLKEAAEIGLKISSKAPDEAFITARTKEVAKDLSKRNPQLSKQEIEKLATSIVKSPDEKAMTKTLRSQFPDITEKEVRKIIERGTREPYGIELLNPKTALITVGSETSEKTRLVLYQRGGLATIFEGPSERQAVIKGILLKGKQTDRDTITKELLKQFPDLGKTEKGKAELRVLIEKTSKDLEQGKTILTRKEAIAAQKQNPLWIATKEKITLGKNDRKKYTVYKGTASPNYEKTDLGRYRATAKNLKKLEDTSEYAFLGTEKTVKASDLLKFPQQVMQSVEKEAPYLATGIYERAQRGRASKPKQTSRPKTDMGLDKIDMSMGQGRTKIEIKTGTTKSTEKLREFAKERAQGPAAKSVKAELNKMENSIRATLGTKTGLEGKTATATRTQQSQRSGVESKSMQASGIRLSTGQTLDNIEIQTGKFKTGLDDIDLTRTAEKLSIRITDEFDQAGIWSLITAKGSKQSQREDLRFRITQKTRQIEKLIPKDPTPTRTTTTTTRTPRPKITIGFGKKERKQSGEKPSKRKLFWRWNVNELSPGQYLPTKELTTGKTKRAIAKIDRIQIRESKKKFRLKL